MRAAEDLGGRPIPERYLVSIATYKRPDDLARLLSSLEVSLPLDRADVVVVDNDPEGSGRPSALGSALGVQYVIEPAPGIASARNRGLKHFGPQYRGILFVDDDEWVAPNWFESLVDYAEGVRAGVVTGPVRTVVPEGAPGWIRRGGFYQRATVPTGTKLMSAATNNTLMTREAWVRAGCPSFDTAFSSTGGSDWDMFWGVRKSGSQVVFCAEALVSEDVPASRLSFRWLRRRALRSGIVNTRVRLKHGDRLVLPLLRGCCRAIYYCGVLAYDLIFRGGVRARSLNPIFFEIGRVSGLAGHRIHEYKR